ncbi:hypothetical protein F511_34403 [Dorcoceras hygrometricum]|uniref:Uncharacterized protein n=1 Tax=Dorcoceras hygrometricum TaxID=472368 RepID=A0A2Z7BNI9_9LAMI|nr:hypothetical protein F511_34403 [Dorcoceras hygrometricum]
MIESQIFLIFFLKPSSSYCSPEAFFPRFPSFSVEDLSVFGGAGFLVNFSFDCYPFEAAERPGRRSRKLLVSGRLLVQADEGVSLPVVDLIDESTAAYREEPVFLIVKQKFLESNPSAGAVCGGPSSVRDCARAAARWTPNGRTKFAAAVRKLLRIWRPRHGRCPTHWLCNEVAAVAPPCAEIGATCCATTRRDAGHHGRTRCGSARPCAARDDGRPWTVGHADVCATIGATCAMFRANHGSARPCAARDMWRRPHGDDLRQIVATAEFNF